MNINEIVDYAINNKISDIHLVSGRPPCFREAGNLRAVQSSILTGENILEIHKEMMSEVEFAEFEENLEIDFAVEIKGHRFRVNAFNVISGPACVMRAIPTEVPTIEQLKLPSSIANLVNLSQGLVLVTGVTGSGKSTTLAALINHINENEEKHILTIEDPIEFIHGSKKSLINQREIGKHSHSYAKALKSSLREDLDVVLVGELRDLETIELAITIAETGHLVFATLHSSSAAQTIDRLVGVFPGNEKEMIMNMLSSSIEAVVSQKLLKKKDGSGLVAAYEVLIATSGVRNLVREGKIAQIDSMLQIGSKHGMSTMKDSVSKLLETGVITSKTAKESLNDLSESDLDSKATSQKNSGF